MSEQTTSWNRTEESERYEEEKRRLAEIMHRDGERDDWDWL